ncbi:response regulator [Tellurirhabdus rosea]|uniref:response regulator n=1 Tax=Tellurirhabdus rosea TaxID=2674997 RepID=UPI002258CB1E|nr:response regulator transcription factor [Tellurirhabdus rosea]
MPRTLLLADDHQLFLDGLRILLDCLDGWQVVGEAHDGLEVLEFVDRQPVDCILMDVQMPKMGGLDTTRQLKKGTTSPKIIAVSMMGDYSTIRQMLQAGADGYLVKNTGIAELRYALEMVMQGNIYLSPQLTAILYEGVAGRRNTSASLIEPLTQREKEVTALIIDGLTNEQIAERLFLSPLTINTHRKNILNKLGCRNTATLVKYVLENNLLKK